MKEDFVTYGIAVKLKEKGFSEKCLYHYFDKKLVSNTCKSDNDNITTEDLLMSCNYLVSQFDTIGSNVVVSDAPTISQVLKWLREEKILHIEIVSSAYGYIYIVSDTPDRGGTDRVNIPYKGKNDGGAWDDYNECVLDAIEYVIDNLI